MAGDVKLSKAQMAVFEHLSEHSFVTCAEAIYVGANGRTLSAMTGRGWLTERYYPNGPRVWELTNDGVVTARAALRSQP